MSRLKRSFDPRGGYVEFSFDSSGNLSSHKDQNGNVTSYGFNSLSLVASKTDALNHTENYIYGSNAKLSRVTDRRGQVSGFSYDSLNRLSQVGFGATLANPTSYPSTIGYTYDTGNRITHIVDSANGTITRAYDGLDRLTREQTPAGTVDYTYDAAGRRAAMTVAGQPSVVYTWDDADRLVQIQQATDTIGFGYDDANRRTSTTLANGLVMAYGYDNANQLTSITYTKGATTLGDLVYSYDAAGRRTSVSGTLARVDLPAAMVGAIYNANNQLMSWAGTTHIYDLNGNLTGDAANTYIWNERDQLSGISGAISAAFMYDGTGRRRSKTIGNVQTAFVYDGMNFVQELNGATVTANLITGATDEVFLRKEGATARHFMADALHSVIALTDPAGVIQTEYSFEPYGKAAMAGSGSLNSQTYTGREDDGSGLFFYRARYYAPAQGRFVAEDPDEFADGPNLYSYGQMNPLLFTDPTGRNAGTAIGAAIGSVFPGPGTAVGAAVGFGVGVAIGYLICREIKDGRSPLDRCLDAAAAGGPVWNNLCNSLKNPTHKAGCWARGPESENNKRGWCFRVFGK